MSFVFFVEVKETDKFLVTLTDGNNNKMGIFCGGIIPNPPK